ncbi:hypothetical protein EXIGLDRAFT_747473 [Exidia glandulosa HHB12029]|uniref:C2H2-type domain-containing protein n=1 Tax=Exidia glandulosa HHB12029 TaxID=1314781 RepID=A0A165KSR4_EXIGL|nr:hypothetical protein EXIGLDRAFT_747473 [Exidia glandulosa HHB12029]
MSDAWRSAAGGSSGYLADDSEGYSSSFDPRYQSNAFPAAAGVGGGYQQSGQPGLYGSPLGPSARSASNYYRDAPHPPAGHSTTSPQSSHDVHGHPLGSPHGSSALVSSADARARMSYMQAWAQGAAPPLLQSPGQSSGQSPGQSAGAPSAQRYNISQYSTPPHPATIAGVYRSSRPQDPVAPSAAALGASYSDIGPSTRRGNTYAGAQSSYVQCTMPDCRAWYNQSDVKIHLRDSCTRRCPRPGCGMTYAGMIAQAQHNKQYHPSDATMEAFLTQCERCLGTYSAHERNCPMNNV